MTGEEKALVLQLRTQGFTFSKIAERLGLSVNTVKSFCTRHKDGKRCLYCGTDVQQPRRVRLKKFCSDKCRMLWWRSHYSELNRKAVYSFKCENCGTEFQAYGNNHRKYCSRRCYINARFGGKINEFGERNDVSGHNEYCKEDGC